MWVVAASLSFWEKTTRGAMGAALWIVLVHVLPLALQASRDNLKWTPTVQRVCGLIVLLAAYLTVGGAAAYLAGAKTLKEAFAWGLGWQGVFGEYVRRHRSGRDHDERPKG